MCRLFGLTGGRERVGATFWLLEAPDSLAEQSRREPDGTGLGYYDAQARAVVAAGGTSGNRHLEHASARGSMRVRSGDLGRRPAVAVASEPMDEDPGWRALDHGELLHVDSDLETTSTEVLDRPPEYRLTLADLDPRAAVSQESRR